MIYIYLDSLLICCDIIFSCCVVPGWVLPTDKPGHGKPGPTGPAQKWLGPSGQSMLSGQAWAVKFGPIAESGQA
jgi:hypothetical protein